MYNELAKEINETARSKGFWDHERNMGEMLMLAVSELAEALEEHRDGRPLVWYQHADTCWGLSGNSGGCDCTPKPEGLVIEIADCAIRCLDTLYNYDLKNPLDIDNYVEAEVKFHRDTNIDVPENIGEALARISLSILKSLDYSAMRLCLSVAACQLLCESLGWWMPDAMRIKMEYNKTREHMHGKAY